MESISLKQEGFCSAHPESPHLTKLDLRQKRFVDLVRSLSASDFMIDSHILSPLTMIREGALPLPF